MLSMRIGERSSGSGSPPPEDTEGAANFARPEDEDMHLNGEPPPSLWAGWQGASVMGFGMFLPALVITMFSVICFERIMRLTFKHPIETLVECALICLIPFANYYAWKAIRHQDLRNPVRLGLMNGAAISTALAVAGVNFASVLFGYPTGFALIGAIALLSAASSIYLAVQLRNAGITRQSKTNRVIFSAIGVVLSLVGLGACEARGTAVRIAESLVLSNVTADRDRGLDLLRKLDCEQDLRMQCADDRTAGIPGLFIRISPQREREVYFAVTGKPYGNSLTESVYSMSDEYLSRHVVGSPIKGLSLLRSAITGYVNAETLTSTVDWTFVFKNGGFDEQEARAEIAIPPGAVISDLTLWQKGEPHQAAFGPTDQIRYLQGAAFGTVVPDQNWVNVSKADPALITDLGRGRVLLKLSAVAPQGEMKVKVTVTERLKPQSLTQATLTLPKFIDANFDLSGAHNLRLHAATPMSTAIENVRKQDAADGGHLLVGNLKTADINNGSMTVTVQRPPTQGPFFAKDTRSVSRKGWQNVYVKETLRQVATTAPEHLVVVIDNSESMNTHIKPLVEALRKLPANVKTSIVVPTAGEQMEPVDLDKGIELISNSKFVGGRDNLQAVIKAAEAAGETKRGAVLWIHGPQPSFNEEMYIMAPYIQRPAFFELAIDDRWTDTNEFFKNHREIGPFVPVARNNSLSEDLQSFLRKWQPGGNEYVVETVSTVQQPDCKEVSPQQAKELHTLFNRDECYKLLRASDTEGAARIAQAARIVTPVTGAVVLGHRLEQNNNSAVAGNDDPVQTAWLQGAQNGTVRPEQYQAHSAQSSASSSTPLLQGATSGTIGPDEVISGINTAGVVRVNNLANLEALLNMLANAGLVLGMAIGGLLLLPGEFATNVGKVLHMPPRTRAYFGAAFMAFGWMLPGFINWMVASSRDANLFS